VSKRDKELFPEPAARVVYAGICALDEASQHDVLRELGKRLAYPKERGPLNTREVRVARAIAAVREAADILGRSPSVNEFRHLRTTSHLSWPPDGSIREWLCPGPTKGWNEVLKQAHLEARPDDAPIVVEGHRAYTDKELIAGLRECAEDLGRVPTFNNYLNWARSPGVRERPGRRTSSQNVFERCFGSYPLALIAARLADASGNGIPVSTLQRSGKNYRWSDEDMMNAISEVIAINGTGQFPVFGEYTRTRAVLLQAEEGNDEPRRIPSTNAFQRRFGGWGKARAFYFEWLRARETEQPELEEARD
jgi:hypothetical protein